MLVVVVVVLWVAYVVHSHISDRIQAQTCTDIFDKFIYGVKNQKKKQNPTIIICFTQTLEPANAFGD